MTNTHPCAGDGFKRCSRFVLRWFTPAKEVPLCGHATLASAAALWTGEGNAADTLHFDTVGSALRSCLERDTATILRRICTRDCPCVLDVVMMAVASAWMSNSCFLHHMPGFSPHVRLVPKLTLQHDTAPLANPELSTDLPTWPELDPMRLLFRSFLLRGQHGFPAEPRCTAGGCRCPAEAPRSGRCCTWTCPSGNRPTRSPPASPRTPTWSRCAPASLVPMQRRSTQLCLFASSSDPNARACHAQPGERCAVTGAGQQT